MTERYEKVRDISFDLKSPLHRSRVLVDGKELPVRYFKLEGRADYQFVEATVEVILRPESGVFAKDDDPNRGHIRTMVGKLLIEDETEEPVESEPEDRASGKE